MKMIIRLFVTALSFVTLMWILISCAENESIEAIDNVEKVQIPVKMFVKSSSDNLPELNYSMYIFKKSKQENDFIYSGSLLSLQEKNNWLRIPYVEMTENDYRFLFIATPSDNSEITIESIGKKPLVQNETKWNDLVIIPLTEHLSMENYFGVTEMSSKTIMSAGMIEGKLKRIVGQMIFEFVRTGTGIDNPIDIDPRYLSVLDRVFTIEVYYKGITKALSFDAENELVAVEKNENEYVETLIVNQNERFQVSVPQNNIGLNIVEYAKGGVRVNGLFLLPSDKGIKMRLLFKYYDTTPVCGLKNHIHIHDCYLENSIELNLPSLYEKNGISVVSDHFTVNKAGVPGNRIIDIPELSDFGIHTAWKKY
ncbi:DUF5031 domain-containing protein [Coprobacter tertius]|uniref:DUF5031 domain-containing protein n=1 Tax=Coprobacter tertius TaxID=2944915 RepID=A0ABT1MLN7_9BACT|nr:DUF5031 domain-containing protein [Coprobacter tertius]MCP9612186.1 DUF5031 domain-containing protein [Coprobacter tertius]